MKELEKAGAKILVDGRKFKAKYENGGYFFGPSIIDYRGTDIEMPELKKSSDLHLKS